jgi:Kinase associated domain 1
MHQPFMTDWNDLHFKGDAYKMYAALKFAFYGFHTLNKSKIEDCKDLSFISTVSNEDKFVSEIKTKVEVFKTEEEGSFICSIQRLSGNAWDFKTIYDKMMEVLKRLGFEEPSAKE